MIAIILLIAIVIYIGENVNLGGKPKQLSPLEKVEYLVKLGYINYKLEPLKCRQCEHNEFYSIVVDHIDHLETKKVYHCKKCKSIVAWWAYGNFQL